MTADRPFGIPPAGEVGHVPYSEDELRLLLQQSVDEGIIDTYERDWAENVFLFGDMRTRQVMVPRGDIDYLVAGETIRQRRASTSCGYGWNRWDRGGRRPEGAGRGGAA